MAGIGERLAKLVGPQSMVRQFFVWGVIGDVVSSALQPFYRSIQHQANKVNPNEVLSPAILADLVVRDIAGHDWATEESRKSGIHPNLFDLLVQNTGVPPSLIDMLMLMRRGKVSRETVIRAVKQSRVKNEWIDTILMLGVQPPTPTEILRAYLQGQVDGDRAKVLYEQLGGDPEFFELLYNTEGSAPTPNEAAEMAHKGIIPWEGTGPGEVSFEQAFLEGPWRNKWLAPWRRMSEYLPPPRTITAMLREGSITTQEATDLLRRQGVPQELVGAYLSNASHERTQKAKELTEGTISNLYQEQALNDDQARDLLIKLRYTTEEANFVLLSWRLNRELKYRNSAITTVHTQFINHRIGEHDTMVALDGLGVPPSQRDALLRLWKLEADTKVVLLTPAQIKSALRKEVIDAQEALTRLVQHGYSEEDAMIFLQI
jgi:hypothetical protein